MKKEVFVLKKGERTCCPPFAQPSTLPPFLSGGARGAASINPRIINEIQRPETKCAAQKASVGHLQRLRAPVSPLKPWMVRAELGRGNRFVVATVLDTSPGQGGGGRFPVIHQGYSGMKALSVLLIRSQNRAAADQ
jgi:hypothetical protein